MSDQSVVISINASWNIVNFRSGLIKALQESGFRVIALAPRDAFSERFPAMGVEYHPIAIDSQGVSPLRDLLLFLRYLSALRRLRPSLFLGYTAKPNIYGSLAARLLGIPVINNVSGLGTAFIRSGLLTRIVTALYRLALKRSHVIFFQNCEDLELFVSRRIVSKRQARLLPGSGIDIDRFQPMPAPANSSPTFLMVARLLWDKGVREYVEAARIVRREVPDARFQILGFLDVENRTAVPRGEVERWVAEGIIEFLGHADDVRPFIAGADCVVLPSYREGLPRSLLEGAAMGKPLIATDAPGCRQVVTDGENGFLCKVRSATSLADAMLRMTGLSRVARARLGDTARARVIRDYDERIPIGHYLDAADQALATGTCPGR